MAPAELADTIEGISGTRNLSDNLSDLKAQVNSKYQGKAVPEVWFFFNECIVGVQWSSLIMMSSYRCTILASYGGVFFNDGELPVEGIFPFHARSGVHVRSRFVSAYQAWMGGDCIRYSIHLLSACLGRFELRTHLERLGSPVWKRGKISRTVWEEMGPWHPRPGAANKLSISL